MSAPELIPPPDPKRTHTPKQALAEDRRTLSKLREAKRMQDARRKSSGRH